MADMSVEAVMKMADDVLTPSPATRTAVAMLDEGLRERAPHEIATLRVAVRRIARLLGLAVREEPASSSNAHDCYCVPIDTLSIASAAAHGIVEETDAWGGIVPLPFIATKLVSHPLWPNAAVVPAGWVELPCIARCTLPGYSVFSRRDAQDAGRQLLRLGDVRIKCPYARGGHGQSVAGDNRQLSRWLDDVDEAMLASGLVLELDLARSRTHSIGSARLPGHEISYCGTQAATRDRTGAEVYAGSILDVHDGGCESMLLQLAGDPVVDIAAAAVDYDRIVRDGYGVVASRRNYDVIEGEDASGRRHVGVLEQSWRFGGASMAEVLAMEAFARRRGGGWIRAQTVESYASAHVPDDAVVSWDGGGDFRTPVKYARIVGDGRRT